MSTGLSAAASASFSLPSLSFSVSACLCLASFSSISFSLAAVSTGLAAPKIEDPLAAGAGAGETDPSAGSGLVRGANFSLGLEEKIVLDFHRGFIEQ